jgi:hypothetical protein
MFERGISTIEVRTVLESGEIIAGYPDDIPFPSYLLLGWVNLRPIHVIVAVDEGNYLCQVITAYIPDSEKWQEDFKARRKP